MSQDGDSVSISERDDGVVVVEVTGELDASSAPDLQRTLLSILGDGRDRVVLDLSRATYLDSSGVGAVIAAYAEAVERGGRFVVASGTGHAARRIRVMGLDSLLQVVESREEACARLAGTA